MSKLRNRKKTKVKKFLKNHKSIFKFRNLESSISNINWELDVSVSITDTNEVDNWKNSVFHFQNPNSIFIFKIKILKNKCAINQCVIECLMHLQLSHYFDDDFFTIGFFYTQIMLVIFTEFSKLSLKM